MKHPIIRLCLLLILIQVVDAKNLPDWAADAVLAEAKKHDPAPLGGDHDSTQFSGDHDSTQFGGDHDSTQFNAVNLLIDHTCTVIDSKTRVLHARECIRILNSDGESYGSKLLLLAPEDRLTQFSAWIKYPDGRVKSLKKKDSVETQYVGNELYLKFRYSLMSLPKACKGAIVCFEYKIRQRMNYPGFDWFFQGHDPTEKAVFTVNLPDGYKLNSRVYWHDTTITPLVRQKTYRYEKTQIPGLKPERFRPALRDAAGHIAFRLMATEEGVKGLNMTEPAWWDIANWFRAISADEWRIPAAISDVTEALCSGLETRDETAAALCQWVQKEIRYVQINLNDSGYVPNQIEDILRVKYGDCKDMAFLLVSMLRSRGIDAWPVLCCGKNSGRVDPDFPSPGVFNHCIVALQSEASGLHYVDPTNKWLAYPLLSPDLSGTHALLVREDGGELVELTAPGTVDINQHASVEINMQGDLNINVSETYSPQAAEQLRYLLEKQSNDEQLRFFSERITAKVPGAVVSNVELKNRADLDQPFVMTCSIAVRGGAGKMGSKLIVQPSFLPEIPVVAFTDSQRKEPIELANVSRFVEQTIELQIPKGLELIEGIPEKTLETDFGFYRIACESSEINRNSIRIHKNYHVSSRLLPPDRYSDVMDFFKSVARSERTVMIFTRSDLDEEPEVSTTM